MKSKKRRKSNPDEVSKSMRKARNADGSLLFVSDEYLTSQQITSFFSRMAAKKSIQDPMNSDDDEDDDDLARLLQRMNLTKFVKKS